MIWLLQVLEGVSQFVVRLPKAADKNRRLKSSALFDLLGLASFSQCLVFSNKSLRAQALSDDAVARGWPGEEQKYLFFSVVSYSCSSSPPSSCVAISIHGQQVQRERLSGYNQLRLYQVRLLFSTDLTARGVDASNVDLVINEDLPWDSETYLHRIGRGGRFGTRSLAVTIVAGEEEYQELRKIVFKSVHRVS